MKEHDFTLTIKHILFAEFGPVSEQIFKQSELLQYINVKTISASKGAKARGAGAAWVDCGIMLIDNNR